MEINKDILRIEIPFEDIYTTVFVVQTGEGVLLFDTATFASDIDEYVFPVLERMGVEPAIVFISHNHRDHAGGLARVVERYPDVRIALRNGTLAEKYKNVVVPADGDVLLESLRVVTIPGHTQDSMGLLDMRSNTLLTGDSLQVYGIYGSGNWGANIRFPREHLAALEKLRGLNVETLIASHDYHPCGYIAQGKEAVECYYSECERALNGVRRMILDFPELDDREIAEKYNKTQGLPTLGVHVVEAVRREMT